MLPSRVIEPKSKNKILLEFLKRFHATNDGDSKELSMQLRKNIADFIDESISSAIYFAVVKSDPWQEYVCQQHPPFEIGCDDCDDAIKILQALDVYKMNMIDSVKRDSKKELLHLNAIE